MSRVEIDDLSGCTGTVRKGLKTTAVLQKISLHPLLTRSSTEEQGCLTCIGNDHLVSPRPAKAMSAGRSLKQLSVTVTRHGKTESFWLVLKVCPKRFDRLPGKRRSGFMADSKGSWPEARTEIP